MAGNRPYTLSIAGFDPSGGAGILADIKTFEMNKVYGLGVISGNTFQNDSTFNAVDWIPLNKIMDQIQLLKNRFTIEYIKIGLIESFEILNVLISQLTSDFPHSKIIWDPILKASAGFDFHKEIEKNLLETICKSIYLITPNGSEVMELEAFTSPEENAKHLANFCHVFLKGGHDEINPGKDRLFTKDKKEFSFRPEQKKHFPKHGSGCILSSALTAYLARGFKLHRACLMAKQYTSKTLTSNSGLLAYHKP